MLPSHELDIRQLELQNKINQPRYLEIRSDEDDSEQRIGERSALMEELADVRLKLIEATRTEGREAEAAMARNVDTDGWSPELREFRELGAEDQTSSATCKATVQERSVSTERRERVQRPRFQRELAASATTRSRCCWTGASISILKAAAIADMPRQSKRTEITGVTAVRKTKATSPASWTPRTAHILALPTPPWDPGVTATR